MQQFDNRVDDYIAKQAPFVQEVLAKTDATQQKRMATTIEWQTQGKSLN